MSGYDSSSSLSERSDPATPSHVQGLPHRRLRALHVALHTPLSPHSWQLTHLYRTGMARELGRIGACGLEQQCIANECFITKDHVTLICPSPPSYPSLCCARTVPQAMQLSGVTDIQLALNLSLRHEVLVEKCCGRRLCTHCGKNFNIADIYLPASGDRWAAGSRSRSKRSWQQQKADTALHAGRVSRHSQRPIVCRGAPSSLKPCDCASQ